LAGFRGKRVAASVPLAIRSAAQAPCDEPELTRSLYLAPAGTPNAGVQQLQKVSVPGANRGPLRRNQRSAARRIRLFYQISSSGYI
jgi:hypothetical protein